MGSRFFSRIALGLTLLFSLTGQAFAHFVFIVPNEDGKGARIVMSETLQPDDQVDIVLVKGLSLTSRDMTGQTSSLTPGAKVDNALPLIVPGEGTRVVWGKIDLGVMERGRSKPHVLVYHPKSILGDAFDAAATMLPSPIVELIPVGKPGAVQFQYNIEGKPAAQTQVVVVLPDGTEKRVVTDDHGRTPAFDQAGAYGVWARHWENKPGERDGKAYEQVRHYATLVAVIPAP